MNLSSCLRCSTEFKKKRKDHKFCSSGCRTKHWKKANGKSEIPDFSTFNKSNKRVGELHPVSIMSGLPEVKKSYKLSRLQAERNYLISSQQSPSSKSIMFALAGTMAGGLMLNGNRKLGLFFGGVTGYMLGNNIDKTNEDSVRLHNEVIVNKIKDIDREIEQELLLIDMQKEQEPKLTITTSSFKSINPNEASKIQHKKYNLTDKWRYFLSYLPHGFNAIVYGMPKAGKTHFSIQLAQYLQRKFGDVIYISGEEGIQEPFIKKVQRYGGSFEIVFDPIGVKGIKDAVRKLEPKFVFIDSLNRLGLDVSDVRELKEIYPSIIFVYVVQATKGGQYRGSQELEHEVTSTIQVIDGKAYQKGRTTVDKTELAVFSQPEKGSNQEKCNFYI